ncbi:MAG: hypothetical protein ACM36C_12655 [Acidobacteriota bacterium]
MSLRNFSRAILAGLLVACTVAPAAAQSDSSPLPSRPTSARVPLVLAPVPYGPMTERVIEVENWIHEYTEWRAWFTHWHNRRQPGVWSWSSRPRKPKPDPPGWLASTCDGLVEENSTLSEGCRVFAEWRDDDFFTLLAREKVAQARADLEAPQKTMWWQHVHLDAFWPLTQTGSHAYGVFGTHVTMPLTNRLQVFLTPGAILMRVPSNDGGQTWMTATDWGMSVRVFEFTMPGLHRPSTVHLNFARVWLLGGGADLSGDLYLAGFSLTFNPRSRSKEPN